MRITTVVFDAYGTLLDVGAAAREAAAEPGGERLAEEWQALSRTWRDQQIGYTWFRTAYGCHADFMAVTADALDFALERHGLAGDAALRETLLGLYRRLAAFPDALPVLEALKRAGLRTAILSNGTPAMLAAAVERAGLGPHLDAILSAEQVGTFKPARAVYDLVGQTFGTARAEVLFVSSNGWDAAAATGYGFRTAWVNRTGAPRERLPWTPGSEVSALDAIPPLVTA